MGWLAACSSCCGWTAFILVSNSLHASSSFLLCSNTEGTCLLMLIIDWCICLTLDWRKYRFSTGVGASKVFWRTVIQLSMEFKRQWALTVHWFNSCFVLWRWHEDGSQSVCETHWFGDDTSLSSGIDESWMLPERGSQGFERDHESIVVEISSGDSQKKVGLNLLFAIQPIESTEFAWLYCYIWAVVTNGTGEQSCGDGIHIPQLRDRLASKQEECSPLIIQASSSDWAVCLREVDSLIFLQDTLAMWIGW